MKKFISLVTLLFFTAYFSYAQERVELVIDDKPVKEGFKNSGGFIFDFKDDYLQVPQWELPKYELMPQFKNPSFDFSTPDMTFGTQNFTYNRYNYNNWGGFHHSVDGPMNSATFRLNNRFNITTYGDYDADGYKRRMPSANPWDKNNFRGGFEMKSNNGKFGIRVEVEQRRGNPYGPNW